MTDPLRVLTTEDLPVQPDPSFAAELRARLESALSLPANTQGVTMSGTATAVAELNAPAPQTGIPRPAALPYLTVADARAAIDWYRDAFGAELIGDPIVMDDGRIGHAELSVSGGVLYLADESPDLGLQAPQRGVNSVSLMVEVADTDAALARARAQGAEVQREPYEGHGSRTATIRDPFGHRWMLSGPVREPIRHGDIGYVSVHSPNPARAIAFYSQVLGWVCDSAGQVSNAVEAIGFSPSDRTTLFCCYAVDDVDEARAAIVAAGGRVDASRESVVGTLLEARDNQGAAFAIYRPDPGQRRPLLNGAGPGELSYVTYEVGESTAFREFFGQVLGWTFERGRVEDGWAVQNTHPMSGAAGGSHTPGVVPMWTVSDVAAAVARVREAGGSVLAEPAPQPYGLTAECTDDQGGRFYLGEF
ncbi:VOC family protein [Mycolicibacterium aichiense]|uniref:Glyoxalase n=1 Tax=Mycolicibacterium aichiense TaxID=1799 RepID=A0AAD1HS92_9MYCO|nr:VOC family protein [Mycolicibacterium aichiense]MCV7016438.1 VOC family protein [Mycolicibacterium aichiense]BBX09788.1 glyoxalase [Mycolicibacterium aichiense]SUA14351.1 glyoxalase/bleomycin resistance protein/dioxygenase [Mycolicibacterium aichiense]